MAKQKKTKKNKKAQRNVKNITKSTRLLRSRRKTVKPKIRRKKNLWEDKRFWSPLFTENKKIDGTNVEYEISQNKNQALPRSSIPVSIQFANPRKVTVCKKRSERRKTLFARHKVGKGKKVAKKRRMTENSHIKC